MELFEWLWPAFWCLGLIAVAIYDFKWRRIPNLFVLFFLLLGFAYHTFYHGLVGLWQPAGQGCLLGFFCLIFLYVLGILKAGDVKVAAALGAWSGFAVVWLLLDGFILGGLWYMFIFVMICMQRFLGRSEDKRWHLPQKIPYAGFFACVALLVVAYKGMP